MLDDGRENEHTEDLEGHLTTSDGHSTRVANGMFFFVFSAQKQNYSTGEDEMSAHTRKSEKEYSSLLVKFCSVKSERQRIIKK